MSAAADFPAAASVGEMMHERGYFWGADMPRTSESTRGLALAYGAEQ